MERSVAPTSIDCREGGHNLQRYEDLGTWITPNDKLFGVGHYGSPTINEKTWKLYYTDTFARSMPIEDAINPANMLCYEMYG
jgi:hypothetical protein